MTSGGTGQDRLNKNQRRDAAREKARVLRDQQKKKDRRNRFLLQGGLIVVSLAIVTIVTLVIINSIRPPAPGPLNMASDGITIGEGFEAQTTPALQAGDEPVQSTPAEGDPIAIEIYLDYQCPVCRTFEEANTTQLETLLERGVATVQYRPVAILDGVSQGTRYSTRAANAAACVANYSPNSYYDFNTILFQNQPTEGNEGLTDEELIGLTEDADVSKASQIASCITDGRFENWVADATDRAANDSDVVNAQGSLGTPTVFVNGEKYGGAPGDASAFAQFVAAADSQAFAEENASPSPSPTTAP